MMKNQYNIIESPRGPIHDTLEIECMKKFDEESTLAHSLHENASNTKA